MIKPIVNIAKIIDAYDAVICGFNGVIHNGRIFFPEAVEVLVKLYQSGKKIALLSNISCRVEDLVRKLHHAGVSPLLFYDSRNRRGITSLLLNKIIIFFRT